MTSTQHLLDTLRPPRVHITYDVEIGDAVEVIELPFVVGVLADLSGDNNANLDPIKQRKFVEVTNDTFETVMAASQPALTFDVPNLLKNDGTSMAVDLNFSSLDDFNPVSVAKQVPDLDALYSVRENLNELLSRVSSNENLATLLEQIATDPTQLSTLKSLVEPSSSSSTSSSKTTSSSTAQSKTSSTASSTTKSSTSDPKPSSSS